MDDCGLAGRPGGAQPGRMAGWMLLALLAVADPASREHAGRASALVTYVAADYAVAVGPEGQVLSPEELAEQGQFVREAAAELRAAAAEDLARELDDLGARVDARVAPPEVIAGAQHISARIAQRFDLAVLPRGKPDLRRGQRLYRQACAACHGADGTPPAADRLPLPTHPVAFASKPDMSRLSPQRVFSAATYGVPGTAMPSFGEALGEEERWDLAFYALTLAHADARERARGEDLLRKAPRTPDYLQLAVRSDDQLRAALSQSGLSPHDREAVLSAVRSAFPADAHAARRTTNISRRGR
ncbi:MAG: c-type cytochrome [Myxococcales bacterium]